MSLLRTLKEENVRQPRFEKPDIYENVIVVDVSGEKRKKKDGSYIPSLFFLKLAQLNPEDGKKIREEDFAFWPTKHDKGENNFSWYAANLALTLSEFLECYYPMEQLEQTFDPFAPFGLTDENYHQDVKKVLGVKKNMDEFNEKVKALFIAHIDPLLKNQEYNLPIRIKVVPSNDGKYLGLADQNWAESMTAVTSENSRLQIGERDLQLIAKWKNIKTGNPAVTAAPMAAATTNPTGAMIPGANIPGATQAGIPGVPSTTPPANQPAPAQQQPANPTTANPVPAGTPQGNGQPMVSPANPGSVTPPSNQPNNGGNANVGQPIPGFPQNNGAAPTADAGMPNPFNNGQNNPF